MPIPNTTFPNLIEAGFLDDPGITKLDTIVLTTIADFLEEQGGMHASTMKHNFRDLGGARDINLVRKDKKVHLPILQDPGGVPQHRRMGYMPMVDARPVPGTPRKGADAMWMTEMKEEEEVAGIHAADKRCLFLENVPTTLRDQQTGYRRHPRT